DEGGARAGEPARQGRDRELPGGRVDRDRRAGGAPGGGRHRHPPHQRRRAAGQGPGRGLAAALSALPHHPALPRRLSCALPFAGLGGIARRCLPLCVDARRITLPPYESDNYSPSYKRARQVARAGLEALRHAARTHHSRTARKGTRERRRAIVHAAGRNRSGRPGSVGAQGILALVKGIADTGFLVAFANANDKHHGWAVQLATGITEPLLTREAVL